MTIYGAQTNEPWTRYASLPPSRCGSQIPRSRARGKRRADGAGVAAQMVHAGWPCLRHGDGRYVLSPGRHDWAPCNWAMVVCKNDHGPRKTCSPCGARTGSPPRYSACARPRADRCPNKINERCLLNGRSVTHRQDDAHDLLRAQPT